jgi:hypothetical protein
MSSIENLKFMPAALPRVNIHPHGHKKGSHLGLDGDPSSDTAAQVPVGTAQNLFGSLLHSLEQVIGLQSAAPAAGSTTSAASISGAAAAATSGAGAATSSAPAAVNGNSHGAGNPLQQYLNNLSRTARADGSRSAAAAVSGVSVNA